VDPTEAEGLRFFQDTIEGRKEWLRTIAPKLPLEHSGRVGDSDDIARRIGAEKAERKRRIVTI
jgi:hypothetical protein